IKESPVPPPRRVGREEIKIDKACASWPPRSIGLSIGWRCTAKTAFGMKIFSHQAAAYSKLAKRAETLFPGTAGS
ncbi:MAG: hypothetical protein WBX20_17555, partial [Terrimicrobiaceae bacterium]